MMRSRAGHTFLGCRIYDRRGRGMDSVLVTLKDISNVNTIYSTFTDSEGRFTLFNDFYSFSLYDTPINFEMYVFVNGYADTLLYAFQKKRICHFEKVSGPDTIRIIPHKSKYRHVFTLSDTASHTNHDFNPDDLLKENENLIIGICG
ncbi:MAG: hypothetical protein ACOC4C_01670 [Fibrobacterota bacterium]